MSHVVFRVFLAASVLAGIASTQAGEVSNGFGINGMSKIGVTLNRLSVR